MQDNPVKFESSHKKRPLLYPIEIMGLGKTKQLVFFSGNVNVIMLDKNYFYEEDKNGKPLRYCDDDGTRWYDKNPYHKAKK